MKKTKKKEKYISERIYNSGRHAFQIQIRLNGQSFRQSVYLDDYPTPAAALAAAVRIRDDILNKIRSSVTVSDFPTVKRLYEDSYKLLPVAVKTRWRHDVYYKNALSPFQDLPIDKVSQADIQLCINDFAKNHTRLESSKLLAVWRRLYKTAAMKDVNVPDRTAGIQIPAGIKPEHRKKEVSPEDLETFLKALLEYNSASVRGQYNNRSVYYAVRIMQYCGLRPAEAFALCRSDVDMERKTISVNKSVRKTEDGLSLEKTKTEQSERIVPMPDKLIPIMKDCLAWAEEKEIILADYFGRVMDITAVDSLVRNVCKKCGVNFTLYMLRHQYSTDLHAAGINPAVIRDLMGHESSSMSLQYAVSAVNDRFSAVNSIFSPPPETEKDSGK